VIKNFGLHLKKAGVALDTEIKFNARYLSLSSIEQIPFWIDKSTKFSEKIFNQVSHEFLSSTEGIHTLEKNIGLVNKYLGNQNI
jgi:hypothetical protein